MLCSVSGNQEILSHACNCTHGTILRSRHRYCVSLSVDQSYAHKNVWERKTKISRSDPDRKLTKCDTSAESHYSPSKEEKKDTYEMRVKKPLGKLTEGENGIMRSRKKRRIFHWNILFLSVMQRYSMFTQSRQSDENVSA